MVCRGQTKLLQVDWPGRMRHGQVIEKSMDHLRATCLTLSIAYILATLNVLSASNLLGKYSWEHLGAVSFQIDTRTFGSCENFWIFVDNLA